MFTHAIDRSISGMYLIIINYPPLPSPCGGSVFLGYCVGKIPIFISHIFMAKSGKNKKLEAETFPVASTPSEDITHIGIAAIISVLIYGCVKWIKNIFRRND